MDFERLRNLSASGCSSKGGSHRQPDEVKRHRKLKENNNSFDYQFGGCASGRQFVSAMTKPVGNDRNKTWFDAFEQFAHFSSFFGMQI
jgi:hypothetical protein